MKSLRFQATHKNQVILHISIIITLDSDNMELLAKLLNLKDNLQKQIFFGILYKKLVVWLDLNIQSDEFVHQSIAFNHNIPIEVVEAINLINDFKESLNYVPQKNFYQEVDLESIGQYSFLSEGKLSDSVSTLEAVVDCIMDMENLIKKNLKLSAEKLVKFTDNNPVQITLREELEIIYKQRDQLYEENQNLKLSMITNRENDSKNLLELH